MKATLKTLLNKMLKSKYVAQDVKSLNGITTFK